MTFRQELIKKIFEDEFTTERTDIYTEQAGDLCVTIWWPEATVTNEYGQSINIEDFFMRMYIRADGTLYEPPEAMRTTYTRSQYRASYTHSHVYPASSVGDLVEFRRICTGTSPMHGNIAHLERSFSEDRYQLLVSQIDDFVHVESIRGVPYSRMSNVTTSAVSTMPLDYSFLWTNTTRCSEFAVNLAKHVYSCLPGCARIFVATGSGVKPGMNILEAVLRVSQYAVPYIKEYNPSRGENLWMKVLMKDMKLYKISGNDDSQIDTTGYGFMFKDRQFPLVIKDDDVAVEGATVEVVTPPVFNLIYNLMLFRAMGFVVDNKTRVL